MSKRRRTTRGSSEDEQVFLEALEADRSKPEILLGLAEVLFQQKRYRGAQGILRQALAIERAAPDLQARIQEVRDRIEKEATNDPVLSVILVAEEESPWLHRISTALAQQDREAGDFEVILLDATGNDSIQPLLKGVPLPSSLRILRPDALTRGEFLNAGVFAARGELLLFIDEDAVPGPQCVRHHIEAHLQSWHKIAVLGAFPPTRAAQRMESATEVLRTATRDPWVAMIPDAIHDWSYFWTCNLSMPRFTFVEAGGFDEELHDPVLLDLELGYRLMGLGLGTRYEPEALSVFDHRPRSIRYLRATLNHDRDHARLFGKHGSGFVRNDEPQVVTNRTDIRRLETAVAMWENRPEDPSHWNQQAILLNLEAALRCVRWPARRIELPHLVRRTQAVVCQILHLTGEGSASVSATERPAIAAHT